MINPGGMESSESLRANTTGKGKIHSQKPCVSAYKIRAVFSIWSPEPL